MIIPLEPNLEGLAERRFRGFARQVLAREAARDQDRITELVEAETRAHPNSARLRDNARSTPPACAYSGTSRGCAGRWSKAGMDWSFIRRARTTSGPPPPVRYVGARTPSAVSCARAYCSSSPTATSGGSSNGWNAPRLPRDTGPSRRLIADGAELQDRLRPCPGLSSGRPGPRRGAARRRAALPPTCRPGARWTSTLGFRFAMSGATSVTLGRSRRHADTRAQPPLSRPRRGTRTPSGNRNRRAQQLRCANGSARPRHRLECARTRRRANNTLLHSGPAKGPSRPTNPAPRPAGHLPVAVAIVSGRRPTPRRKPSAPRSNASSNGSCKASPPQSARSSTEGW